MEQRISPSSVEAEEAVLGSILIDSTRLVMVSRLISSTDFYIVKNGWIYEACRALWDRREPIDILTVGEALKSRGQLAEVGGPSYLSRLLNVVPTAMNAEGYAEIVRQTSLRRKMIKAASAVAILAYEDNCDVDAQVGRAISLVRDLQKSSRATLLPAAQLAVQLSAQIEDWRQQPLGVGEVRGLPTGFRAIDQMTGGLESGNLYVMAARPAMGKSALACQIACNVASSGKRALVFSLEMTGRQILARLACGAAKIDWECIRRGSADEDTFQRLTEAIRDLEALDLYISDSSYTTSGQIEALVAGSAPVDLVVVDYLGLLGDPMQGQWDSDVKRLGRLTKALKRIAKEYNTVMLVLHQLNRGVESRQDKRPLLSDLRDSGEIEQDADGVLMLYRDEYYNPETSEKCVLEVWPRKMRNGSTDTAARLAFLKQYTRFGTLDRSANDLNAF